MDYQNCETLIAATLHIFAGTPYAVDYYLDAEPFFTLNGEIIEDDELPADLHAKFLEVLETLEFVD